MPSSFPNIPSPPSSPSTTTTSPPPFPLTPHLWTPRSPISISLFLNYTRTLTSALLTSPSSLTTRHFELEAFILLLHHRHQHQHHTGKHIWFGIARQVMGNILTTYTPQELEEEERNWAAVRLQYACRGLIDVRRWSSSSGVGQEGEKGRRVNEWMRGEVQKMLGRCCIGENGGWKAIAEEDVRRCEEWTQGMFSGRGRVMFDHEGEFYGCFAGDDDVNGLS